MMCRQAAEKPLQPEHVSVNFSSYAGSMAAPPEFSPEIASEGIRKSCPYLLLLMLYSP
jgi:hypothetical protein